MKDLLYFFINPRKYNKKIQKINKQTKSIIIIVSILILCLLKAYSSYLTNLSILSGDYFLRFFLYTIISESIYLFLVWAITETFEGKVKILNVLFVVSISIAPILIGYLFIIFIASINPLLAIIISWSVMLLSFFYYLYLLYTGLMITVDIPKSRTITIIILSILALWIINSITSVLATIKTIPADIILTNPYTGIFIGNN